MVEHIITPHEWRDRFSLHHGAVFGASPTPGTGLPLVVGRGWLPPRASPAEQER